MLGATFEEGDGSPGEDQFDADPNQPSILDLGNTIPLVNPGGDTLAASRALIEAMKGAPTNGQ